MTKKKIDDPESRLNSAVAVPPSIGTFGSRRLGKNTCPPAYHSSVRWVTVCVHDTVRGFDWRLSWERFVP